MPPKAKVFSVEVEEKLIFEIERRPILWDVTLKDYKRADLKPAAWAAIAVTAFGTPINSKLVSKRLKNIKETYMKNLTKMRESKNKCSENGSKNGFKPVWPLYEKLKFFEKIFTQAESESNLLALSSAVKEERNSSNDDLIINDFYYDETCREQFIVLSEETSYTEDISGNSSNESSKTFVENKFVMEAGSSSADAKSISLPTSIPTPVQPSIPSSTSEVNY